MDVSYGKKQIYDLDVPGQASKGEISHQKRVQKLNELIESRIERKKRVKELMAKRAGNFDREK